MATNTTYVVNEFDMDTILSPVDRHIRKWIHNQMTQQE